MLMRCSACGEENPATNLFCSKCASSLAKEQARIGRSSRVYLPPQAELDRPVKHSRKSTSGFWLLGLLAIVIVLGLVLYG